MTYLPIVARELRVASRRRRTYFARVAIAAAAVALAGLLLPTLAVQFSRAEGKTLFWTLSTCAFGYCLVAGTRATSDCLSSEKREGTIGLLFLTDLKGYDVVLGKLVSCSLTALYGLLAAVPVLALALLLGGITLSEVGRMTLLFINTLFFSMAAGVFVSTISRNDRRAMFATACLILVTAAAPFSIAYALMLVRPSLANNGLEELSFLLLGSPVFAFEILRESVARAIPLRIFYESLAATHGLAWLLLILASRIVPHVCRERPPGQWGLRWREFRDRWSYGSPSRRRAFRARLLDRNAFYWLAARDRIKAYYVWFFVAALALIWCWSGWVMQSYLFDWDVSFWALFLLFFFFKIWLASEVTSRFVEDRASGAFELLLSSPLELKDMAHGQSLALRRQFGRPIVLALVLANLLLLSALHAPHYNATEGEIKLLFWGLMMSLLADLITLKWVCMWQALATNQVTHAMVAACARILVVPTGLFLACYAAYLLVLAAIWPASNQDSLWSIAGGLWLAIGLATDLFFGLRARWSLLHHFREIATERYSAPSPGLAPLLELWGSVWQRLSPKRGPAAWPTSGTVRWKRWLLAGAALVLTLAVTGLAVWKHSLRRELDARFAAIRAQGQPVTLPELEVWLPMPGSSQSNGAAILQKAIPYIWYLNQLPRNSPVTKRLDWPGPVGSIPPAAELALTNLVSQNRRSLELMHAAAKLRESRFTIDWHAPQHRYAPAMQLRRLGFAGEIVQFEGLLALENGDTNRAIQDVHTLLGLGRIMAQEPYWIAQNERLNFLLAAVRLLERFLNHQPLADEELEDLVRGLHEAQIATGDALARTLIGERCIDIESWLYPDLAYGPARPTTPLEQFVTRTIDNTADLFGVPQTKVLIYLGSIPSFIETAGQLGKGQEDGIWKAYLDPRSVPQGTPTSTREGYEQGWRNLIRHQCEMVLQLRAAEVACQIERFRATNGGQLPESINALRPHYVGTAPSGVGGEVKPDQAKEAPRKALLPWLSIQQFLLASQMNYSRLKEGYVVYPPLDPAISAQRSPAPASARPQNKTSRPPLGFTVER